MSDTTNKNWDDQFRQEFEGAELQPREETWNRLEQDLIYKMTKRNRRGIIWLRVGVAASFLMLLGLGALQLMQIGQEEIASEKTIIEAPLVQEKTEDVIPKQTENIRQVSTAAALLADEENNQGKVSAESEWSTASVVPTPGSPKNEKVVINLSQLDKKEEPGSVLTESQVLEVEPTSSDPISELAQVNVVISQVEPPAANVMLEKNAPAPTQKESSATVSSGLAENDQKQDSITPLPQLELQLVEVSDQPELNIDPPNQKSNPRDKPWSFGGGFSPDLAYQAFSSSNKGSLLGSASSSTSLTETYRNSTKPKLSFSSGFSFGYRLSRRWSIRTGLVYTDKGEQANGILIFNNSNSSFESLSTQEASDAAVSLTVFSVSDQSSSIFANNFSPETSTFILETADEDVSITYHYQFLDIPLVMQFDLITSPSLNYFISAGMALDLFLGYWINSTIRGEKQSNKGQGDPFRKLNYVTQFSTGLAYHAWESWTITLEPTYRYSLSSIAKEAAVSAHPYSFGLMTGIKYHF